MGVGRYARISPLTDTTRHRIFSSQKDVFLCLPSGCCRIFYALFQGAAGFFMPYFRVLQAFLCFASGFCRIFLWLLPLRQVATMSLRCKSVMSVLSVHSAREVLWDAMQTRHNWLGIFTALVQDYLTENFSWELLF